jgi:predicted Holliday junction resolvase-like endonuclease
MNILAQTIDGIQELLAICPCCGEIFRLVEGKFIFPQKRPEPCEYLELIAREQRLSDEEDRLDSAEERFEEELRVQKQRFIELGRRRAKKKLKKIDPTFSAKDIDPQDVRVIFDPVEYLVFHGLNSDEGVDLVEFVSRSPESRAEETIAESIERTIRNGDVEFETLHMRDDGSFEIRKEASGR